MKIQVKNESVILIPEHDLDCYNLGKISTNIGDNTLKMTKSTDNPKPKINGLEISIDELLIKLCQLTTK